MTVHDQPAEIPNEEEGAEGQDPSTPARPSGDQEAAGDIVHPVRAADEDAEALDPDEEIDWGERWLEQCERGWGI